MSTNILDKDFINKLIKNPDLGKTLKVNELVTILTEANDKYYNDTELMPDITYDKLRDILMQKSPKNKFLLQIGAPISKEKVKLPYPMASLNKIKPENKDLPSWLKKYNGPYYLSDKLDGVSGLLHNSNGITKFYTRGDGTYGQDITHLLKYIHVPTIKDMAIRGEIIIKKSSYDELCQNDVSLNREITYKNPRNAIASLVNSKTIPLDLANKAEFIAYSVISPELTFGDQIKLLKKLKFPTVTNKVVAAFDTNMLGNYFIDRRKNSEYEVDGIVVIDNSKIYPLGKELGNPDYAFAFKMQLDDQTAQVKVLAVEWECSKHRYIKPRVKIEPVNLVGVTITYATAFNAKFVVDNNLGPGAIIEIVRSGDVIPDIKKVIKGASKPSLPNIKYEWTSTNVDIIADPSDETCNRIILIKQINSFFTIIGVKYFSDGIITKIVDNGYKTIFDIIKAFNNDKKILYKIEGLGNKMVDKINININLALNSLTLEKLMGASNIFGRGFGVRRSKLIVKAYPNLLSKNLTIDDIISINGFDLITAKQFIDHLDEFKKFYKELSKIHDIKYLNNITVNTSVGKYKDKKFVLTGFRNAEIEQYIENNGGSITSSVSKNTFMVVYTDTTSAKYIKATSLGITTIDLATFKKNENITN